MVENIYRIWMEKKIRVSFLIDVKGAFDYIFQVKQVQQIRRLEIDNYLIGWTRFFLIDRKVEIIIDGHINQD